MTLSMKIGVALDQAFDYIGTIEKQDISQVDNRNRDSGRTHKLLRSYARHQGAQASYINTLKNYL